MPCSRSARSPSVTSARSRWASPRRSLHSCRCASWSVWSALASKSRRPMSVLFPSSTLPAVAQRSGGSSGARAGRSPSEVPLALPVFHRRVAGAVVRAGGAALRDRRPRDLANHLLDRPCRPSGLRPCRSCRRPSGSARSPERAPRRARGGRTESRHRAFRPARIRRVRARSRWRGGRARAARISSQTSSSVKFEIGKTRRCWPGRSRVLWRLQSSGRWFFGSHRPRSSRRLIVRSFARALSSSRRAPPKAASKRCSASASRSVTLWSPFRDARDPEAPSPGRARSCPRRALRVDAAPSEARCSSRKVMTSGKLCPVSTCITATGRGPGSNARRARWRRRTES